VSTTLLLARHGETDANRERRWQGQTQTALNDTGREQARTLARELAAEPPDAIFCSDLDRARETAEIIGAEVGRPVFPEPKLREVDVGSLAGKSVTEMHGDWARPLDYLLAKQPEIFEEMRTRVIDALFEIAAARDGERVLVVTHGGPIAAAWFACGGEPTDRPSVPNCHVHRIRVEGRTMTRLD
jgi:probable phosphoglycerate mutase